MTDKENKWIKFHPSLELPKERVSIAYDTHDERKIRYAYGYFQFHNGNCSSFWKDGNETPKVVKIENIRYWMPVPSFDSMQEECNITSIKSKEATGKLKECIDNITDESLAKARKQLQEELVNGGLDLGCGVIWKDEKSASGDLEEVVEEIVDPTVLNAYGVKEIANRLRRTMIGPVSEDLGKVGSLKSLEYYPEKKTTNKTSKGVFDANMPRRKAYLRGFKDGAHAHKELIANKPVSEDLEEVIRKYEQRLEKENPATEAYDFASAIRFGANWQKHKDESKVLTEEQCRKIRDDAFELGKDAMKQQLMKNAVKVNISNASIVSLPVNCDLKVGDKVLIIKED